MLLTIKIKNELNLCDLRHNANECEKHLRLKAKESPKSSGK